jgi:hypothetical protein
VKRRWCQVSKRSKKRSRSPFGVWVLFFFAAVLFTLEGYPKSCGYDRTKDSKRYKRFRYAAGVELIHKTQTINKNNTTKTTLKQTIKVITFSPVIASALLAAVVAGRASLVVVVIALCLWNSRPLAKVF